MNKQDTSNDRPVQNSKQIWITVVATVFAVSMAGGGVYAWQRSIMKSTERALRQQISILRNEVDRLGQQQRLDQSTLQNTPEDQELKPSMSNDIFLETYRNPQFGFEFQYPDGITITDTSQTSPDGEPYQVLNLKVNVPEMHFNIVNTPEAFYYHHRGAPTKYISEEEKQLGQLTVKKSIIFGYQILPNGTWVLSYDFSYRDNEYIFTTWMEGVEESNPIPESTEKLMEQILLTLTSTK